MSRPKKQWPSCAKEGLTGKGLLCVGGVGPLFEQTNLSELEERGIATADHHHNVDRKEDPCQERYQ